MKLPVVFLGHGSPMNAIAKNDFTKALAGLAKKLPKPQVILSISAHWMTQGTFVTHMEQPKTIHDFQGFPKALFEVQYPAPGSPKIADLLRQKISNPEILADDGHWGLDHGTWSVLKHIYPAANIPVFQLSLDMTQPPDFHYNLGKKLAFLREHDVLIIGSGNIVHNLRAINWNENAPAHHWAVEFDQWVKTKIDKWDFAPLVSQYLSSEAGKLSVPTPEHYYPLLYALGATSEQDKVHYIYEGIQNASISMRCIWFGF